VFHKQMKQLQSTWYLPARLILFRVVCLIGGRPVRTKSHQNESIFRSNRTKNFVLMGVRSDGISF